MEFLGEPKKLLKNASIAFIVFGAINAVYALITMFSFYGLFAGLAVILLIEAVGFAAIGYLGMKKSADASQFNFFIYTGGALCALGLFSVVSGGVIGVIGLLLPGLYIYGGLQLKKGV